MPKVNWYGMVASIHKKMKQTDMALPMTRPDYHCNLFQDMLALVVPTEKRDAGWGASLY